ncbi:MAG: hypothetical protein Q8N59_00605 [bacterium]|nr:hypothetical protein [bacterium]
MKPGILIAIIAVLVVAVVVIIIIGTSKEPTTTPGTEIKPLEETQLAEITEDIKGISGKVIAIGKDTITVEALIMMKDTTQAPIKHNVKITADASTSITRLTFPSPEKIMGSTDPIIPKEETLKLNELRIGDTVDVRADNNIYDSIKAGTPFVASTINAIAYE